MVDDKQLYAIIETLLKERFANVDIDTVDVVHDTDEDGDDILRVQVIFNGKSKTVDARETTSLLRYMRPRIAEIGEKAFPIVSFIAKSEWEHKTATA